MKKNLFILFLSLLFFNCEKDCRTTTSKPEKENLLKVEVISYADNSALQDLSLIKVKAEDDKSVVHVEMYINNNTVSSRALFSESYDHLPQLAHKPNKALSVNATDN